MKAPIEIEVLMQAFLCDVPDGHSNMLQEPQVRVFAEKLQVYINEALFQEAGGAEQDREVLLPPPENFKSIQTTIVLR